jgi:outer membrane protein OmpA-like peptidoglycan-associated protein
MIHARGLCAAFAVLFGVTGCAGYSNVVNSFAPPRQKSDVVIVAGDALEVSSEKSELCVEPPPPPKKAAPIEEVYMVMPEGGGKIGTVAVTFNDGREVVLQGAYSAMSLAGEETKAYVGDQSQLEKTFGSAVSALPKAPMSATLYFLLGKDELTPESRVAADKIYSDFVSRQAPEIWVIGHTDTVGSAAHNQKLSVKRAEKVRKNLIKLGVPEESIQSSGRGESEPLVETPDNIKEPKNRRVEISVR